MFGESYAGRPSGLPTTLDGWQPLMAKQYAAIYASGAQHESVEASIDMMAARCQAAIRSRAIEPHIMLELGSGPQKLTRTVIDGLGDDKDDWQFFTLDSAHIEQKNLLAANQGVTHYEQSATEPLPIAKCGLLVAHLCLDFMPPGLC